MCVYIHKFMSQFTDIQFNFPSSISIAVISVAFYYTNHFFQRYICLKGRVTKRERGEKKVPFVYSPSGCSHQVKARSGSFTWVFFMCSEAPALGPFSAFARSLAKSWVWSGAPGTAWVPTWDEGILGLGYSCCTTSLVPLVLIFMKCLVCGSFQSVYCLFLTPSGEPTCWCGWLWRLSPDSSPSHVPSSLIPL